MQRELVDRLRALRRKLYEEADQVRLGLYAGTPWADPKHSLLRLLDGKGDEIQVRTLAQHEGHLRLVRTQTDELGIERSTLTRLPKEASSDNQDNQDDRDDRDDQEQRYGFRYE